MNVLEGRVAIVTGGGQGIGRGIALALSAEGARVAVLGRTGATLEATCGEIAQRGGKSIAVRCDVSKIEDIGSAVSDVVSRFGGVQILVNNAQTIARDLLIDMVESDIQDMWASGPLATLRMMRTCYPYLRGDGAIVNFSSNAAHSGGPAGMGVYAAVKAAIESLTRSAALEWCHEGIRVNAILPMASSPIADSLRLERPEAYEVMMNDVPLGRLGDCEKDIGRAVVYLTGPDAGMITGTFLAVDGGRAYLR